MYLFFGYQLTQTVTKIKLDLYLAANQLINICTNKINTFKHFLKREREKTTNASVGI